MKLCEAPGQLTLLLLQNLRDFLQKVHGAATVAMGELRREIEDLIADISGIITEIINFVKDNLGNSQDVNRACRSLNNVSILIESRLLGLFTNYNI